MDDQRLGDDRADRHAGVERRVRILKHDLHARTQGPHLSAGAAISQLQLALTANVLYLDGSPQGMEKQIRDLMALQNLEMHAGNGSAGPAKPRA